MRGGGSAGEGAAGDGSVPTRSEFELLVHCAREQVRSGAGERLAGDAFDDLDWTAVRRLARRHRVRPLVHRSLDAGNIAAPPDVRADFETASVAIGGHNLLVVSEAIDLLDRLAARGIRALTYKGPSLACLAYGDVAYREFADLDVLVPAADFPAAVDVLRAGNYRVETDHPFVGQTVLRERDTDLPVDLHHTLTPTRYPFDFRFDRLWDRRVRVSASGTTIRTLAPSDLVSILAVHGTKHYWTRLEWIVSFAALARRQDVGWSRVLCRSDRIGCRRMVLFALALSRTLLGLALPERVSRAIAEEWGVTTMAERILNNVHYRNADGSVDSRAFHRDRHLLQLSLMCGLRAKGTYAARVGRSVTACRVRRFLDSGTIER